MENQLEDVQSRKILSGIRALKDVLRDDNIRNILEFHSNIESNENFTLLNRLERSLDQYLKKDQTLIYIGFLGHYSSGKSSTINSLLNLGGTKNERKVNINPTDDQITLLTDARNENQLVQLARVGSVPVVISPTEGIEFLTDKIIIDTPGSGDPNLFEEIVRDSLPMCDVLIYCISAANPLDNSDIPLIKEKEKNLKDLPTIYAITRGNEFRLDRFKKLDESNFNEKEAKKSLHHLSSRIKEIFDSINLEWKDFVIIDNIDGFRIDQLRDEIQKITNKSNHQNLIKLHSHKIDFFLRTSSKIRSFFIELIASKLSTVDIFFNQAEQKIDEYDKKTVISGDRLINKWMEADDKIKQILEGSISENNKVHDLLLSKELLNDVPIIEDKIDKFLKSSKEINATRSSDINAKISHIIYDLKESVKEKIRTSIDNKERLKKEEISAYIDAYVEECDFEFSFEVDYLSHYEEYYEVSQYFLSKLNYENFNSYYSSILGRLKQSSPAEKISKQLKGAEETLKEIFQTYFESVEIYKVAAFSIEAKNYIKKLGLSDQLDALDSKKIEIDEPREKARNLIFEELHIRVDEFKKKCRELFERLSDLKLSRLIHEDHGNSQMIRSFEKKGSEYLEKTSEKHIQNSFHKIKTFLILKMEEVNDILVKEEFRKEEKLKNLRKARVNFYIKGLIPAGTFLLFSLISVLFFIPKYFDSLEANALVQWVIGLLSNVAFASVNTLIVKRRDDFPSKFDNLNQSIQADEKKESDKHLEDGFRDSQSDILEDLERNIKEDFDSEYSDSFNEFISKKSNSRLYNYHKGIVESEIKLKAIINEFSGELLSLKGVLSQRLKDEKFNLKVLNEQAGKIKENSINPSYDLLKETRKDILEIKQVLKEISLQ